MSQSSGFPRWLNGAALGIGGICSALRLAVLAGWHAGSARLIQGQPDPTPIAYPAGLAFVLCGAGFLLLVWSRFGAARVCRTAVAATGVPGLAESLFSVRCDPPPKAGRG